jgi:alanine dehydrogenase
VFIRHGVVHYCVPNMTASVGRTATAALTNAMVPYLLETANSGIEKSFLANPGLAKGVCTFAGHCTNSAVARIFDLQQANLFSLLTSRHNTEYAA